MNMPGAGDVAEVSRERIEKIKANEQAFNEAVEDAIFKGLDFGAASYDCVRDRISDNEDLSDRLIEARATGNWSTIERMIDEAIEKESEKARKIGFAA